jgi:5-(hydroxymethyl)furfural/furfural oxidase
LEAGRDTPPGAIPADIADTFPSSSLNASYFWPGLHAVRSTGTPARPYVQARVMGRGSSVMGLWALRGMPSDYDFLGGGWGERMELERRVAGI